MLYTNYIYVCEWVRSRTNNFQKINNLLKTTNPNYKQFIRNHCFIYS